VTRDYTVFCLSEAISPLTHMRGVSGNEALVMREPVTTPRGVVWVPSLSGNAIRHRFIREPGWRWLIERWGLAGQLTLPQLNYCFHGGNLTEGGGRENTRQIADMQRLFPLQRLLGGALPSQIVSGSLDVWRGRLVCEENRAGLAADLPADWELPAPVLRPAECFVSGYQYTRGDARKTALDLLPSPNSDGERQRGENADGSSNLMIFSGQSVTRGALFTHGFVLKHVSELELGALYLSLRLWQAAGGTIGGQASRGHGRLKTRLFVDADLEAAASGYAAHCDATKEEACRWLAEAFAARGEVPGAAGKGKKTKAKAVTTA
jgi:hypothetical protein